MTALLTAVPRKLHYLGYHQGSPVVEGELEFAVASDGKVAGNWKLARVASASSQTSKLSALALGPQIGEGELVGEVVAAGELFMRTTRIADYDVSISSKNFRATEIVGVWQYRTEAGVETEGTFHAATP